MKHKLRNIIIMNMLMIPAITLSGNTIISVQAEEETNFSAENETDLQTLFNDAVEDAIIIEENEILPVISLAKGEEYSVCDEDGRILLYTFHKYPDSYPDGANVTLECHYGIITTNGKSLDFQGVSAFVAVYSIPFPKLKYGEKIDEKRRLLH